MLATHMSQQHGCCVELHLEITGRSVADKHCKAAAVEIDGGYSVGQFTQTPLLEIDKYGPLLRIPILKAAIRKSPKDPTKLRITSSSVKKAVTQVRNELLGDRDDLACRIKMLFSMDDRNEISRLITLE